MKVLDDVLIGMLRIGIWSREKLNDSELSDKSSSDKFNNNLGRLISESCLMSERQWNALFSMASRNAVIGIVGSVVSSIGRSLESPSSTVSLLPETISAKLKACIDRIKESHLLLNVTIAQVNDYLCDRGIRPVLLKGQGVALEYTSPTMRQCGDIDLYVRPDDFKKACSALSEICETDGGGLDELSHHAAFKKNGIPVELHFKCAVSVFSEYDKKISEITERYLHCPDGNFRKHSFGGKHDVFLPPADFDAFYLLYHLIRHFIYEGVGLRHFCDYAVFMHSHSGEIDKAALVRHFNDTGVLKLYEVLRCLMVRYFGVSPDTLPAAGPEDGGNVPEIAGGNFSRRVWRKSEKMLALVMECGNFGFFMFKPRGFNSVKSNRLRYYLRKADSLSRKLKWRIRIFSLFPAYVSGEFPRFVYSHVKSALRGGRS